MSEYIVKCKKCVGISGATMQFPEYIDMNQEIVRCRDCAYIFHRKYSNGFEYQTCSYFDSEYAEVEPDGFCAWAVKRKEGK